MVDRAQAQPVRDDGLAALLEVADDVRGVEEALVPERADGAPLLVRREDQAAEVRLVNARASLPELVLAPTSITLPGVTCTSPSTGSSASTNHGNRGL